MSEEGRRRTTKEMLFVIAFCASLVFVLAVVLNSFRLQPNTYELTGSSKLRDR